MIINALILLCILLVALFLYWRLFLFFRDPNRRAPEGNNIVSPADGTVVYVRKVINGNVPISIKNKQEIKLEEIIGGNLIDSNLPYFIVGIFMHPTSVHVNRAPISGIIKKMVYTHGSNLPMTIMWWRVLFKRKPYELYSNHILKNERNTTLIEGEIPLVVVQIADIYIKRIESWVKENDIIKKGQRIGVIKMGSQVDIVFPALSNIEIITKENQKVKAGESILAVIK